MSHLDPTRLSAGGDLTPVPSSIDGTLGSVGPYRLLQQIGEGGMGEVWLAEQTQPVRREVALKVIKPGMDSAQVIARFEAERQALAMMDHPNIAKVFDGGTTAGGRPYFVMEYVRGEPINRYCDRVKMPLRERLELFAELCEGVQHAHQKGVIHRDLKPSNVLVSVAGDRPIPRIIDFGIAKATGPRLTDTPLHTEIGAFIGTPEYMSPEQAEASSLDVDTRTDIYSLGIILYELLTGFLPFDSRSLRSGSAEDMRRTIREHEPPRPSTRVRQLGDTSSEVSARRATHPRELASTLRGDLDWITLKALEKNPAQRYDTASAFAQDIHRFLRNEPVLAGPPSAAYRTRKFVARHRFGVTVGATFLVLIVVFGAVMAVQARRVADERDRARAAQAKSDEVAAFLVDMFRASDPTEAPSEDMTARELLDKGVQRVDTLGGQPEVQAELLRVMARAYKSLGNFKQAHALMERGLGVLQAAVGTATPEVGTLTADLGDVLYEEGRLAEAEEAFRRALAIHEQTVGHATAATATDLHLLGKVLVDRGARDEAERHFNESLAIKRQVLDPRDPEIAEGLSGLAYAASRGGDYGAMERYYREALQVIRDAFGERHPRVALALNNLASALDNQGRYDEAARIHREALEMRRALFGEQHPAVATSLNNLATVLQKQEKYAEAEPLVRQVVELRRKLLGPEHQSTALALNNLGVLLYRTGTLAESEQILREAYAVATRRLAPDHALPLSMHASLAAVIAAQGRDAEAEALFRSTHADRVRTLGPEHPDTATGLTIYGRFLSARKRYVEAETMLKQSLDLRTRLLGPKHPETLRTSRDLLAVYQATGQREQAAEIERLLR
jgi:eukaryotic-like serine/threonine-protein kinase